jgi:UDP-glucose 4-epimerase
MASRFTRVLILGHTGYIGSHLAAQFAAGSPAIEVLGRSLPRIDLTTEAGADAVEGMMGPGTLLVVCAAIKKQLGDTRETLNQNLAIVMNLCRILERTPADRCVFFSSAAVYGEDVENTAITEATPVCPTSYYGIGKFTAERLLVKTFASRPDALLILRPALVYGPRESGSFYGPSGFLNAVREGKPITLWGDGTEKREFVFIRDLAMLVHALAIGEASGIVNVVTGQSRTFVDALAIAATLVGRTPEVGSRPRSKAKVDHGFDNALLRRHAPAGFTFTTLEDGMRQVLAEAPSHSGQN